MILMDTCAILWDALSPEKLSQKALSAINKADKNNELIISDISIWEIAMLVKKQRIMIETSAAHLIDLFLQSRCVSVQSITPRIAELAVNFDSRINKDPADRIIAATSIVSNARLLTADRNLLENELLDTLW